LTEEEAIRDALNEVGVIGTSEILKKFDTDGTPIMVGGIKFYRKEEQPKTYQILYGDTVGTRHVYQNNEGRSTYCPLDEFAISKSTPLFAKRNLWMKI